MSSIAQKENAFSSFKNFLTTFFAIDIKDEESDLEKYINDEKNIEDAAIAKQLQQSLLAIEKAEIDFNNPVEIKKNKKIAGGTSRGTTRKTSSTIKSEKSSKMVKEVEDEIELSK